MAKETLKSAVLKAKEILLTSDQAKVLWANVGKIKGFKDFFDSFSVLWEFLKLLIQAVETVSKEYKLCTADERIDVAAEILDELIEFKGWAAIVEPFDNMLFKLLISSAVSGLNDLLGHIWSPAPTTPAATTPVTPSV